MASAAEQLAANLNLSAFAKAEELKKRIWFTLGALLIYRIGTFIPIPGINLTAFAAAFQNQSGGILGMMNMFAGGAIERMAIFALNIMPYITASIIMQLMQSMVPSLEALKKEGEQGQKQLNQYTRYLTVLLASVQALVIAWGLNNADGGQAGSIVVDPGPFFIVSTVVSLVGGTMFLMWLGEQITARGVGNGPSLIIMAGIVAGLPGAILQTLELARQGVLSWGIILVLVAMMLAVVAAIVFIERAQRRLLVQYPKRQMGNRMFQGDASHLPLKLNASGVIPPIFASSLLMMPGAISTFSQGGPEWLSAVLAALGQRQPLWYLTYVALIIFFAFFYTSIVLNPQETADNLRKYGGFLPGIRPGAKTAAYIDYVLTRITVVGAVYLAAVCVLPEILQSRAGVSFYFGGTSLLIAVSVTMDTVARIHSHLLAHQYEGLIKKAKLRGATRRI
jgi:preprotein translocase subunit SecY